MIVTKQNHIYITTAISTISETPEYQIAWGADTDENLVIMYPENVDINAVEAEIINAKATIDLAGVRKQRDALLSETDWWVLPDRTPTDAQLAYRQALRDITDTYSSLDDVVWPTKPE
jgi:leucyl aminopeptidase (aminopeptidase T)